MGWCFEFDLLTCCFPLFEPINAFPTGRINKAIDFRVGILTESDNGSVDLGHGEIARNLTSRRVKFQRPNLAGNIVAIQIHSVERGDLFAPVDAAAP